MFRQAVSNYTDVNSSPDDKKKLFFSGLSLNTDNERLRAFFSRFGEVKDCHVMLDEKGRSRCCGFLNYEGKDVSSVDQCMRLRPHKIDGQQITTKRAMLSDDPHKSEPYLTAKRIFIGGLRIDINEAKLQEYFSRFGNIREVLCVKNVFGKPRGFAFISFDDYDAVDKVMLEDLHSINGRRLDVRKAIAAERFERISVSYESKSGPSSNNNISGHISNPNWNNRVQPRSNNNNSGHINDKNWDNQLRYPSYNQQGCNSNGSNMDAGFSSSYNSIRQNQPPSIIQSMRDRNSYDAYQDTPFNSYGNQSSISNSMPPSYEKNRQQNYDVIPNDFGGMNNHFNQTAVQKNGEGSNSSFLSNSFDNSNSYGATSHNYNEMPRQQSPGGGPMHRGRGRGGGPFRSNKLSNYANRSAPYPTHDSSSNYHSRGRGQLNKN